MTGSFWTKIWPLSFWSVPASQIFSWFCQLYFLYYIKFFENIGHHCGNTRSGYSVSRSCNGMVSVTNTARHGWLNLCQNVPQTFFLVETCLIWKGSNTFSPASLEKLYNHSCLDGSSQDKGQESLSLPICHGYYLLENKSKLKVNNIVLNWEIWAVVYWQG